MPKRTSTKLDSVQNAKRVLDQALSNADAQPMSNPDLISQVMAEMGRKGGLIGGKRRLTTMTAAERHNVASQAAKARWAKAKKTKKHA